MSSFDIRSLGTPPRPPSRNRLPGRRRRFSMKEGGVVTRVREKLHDLYMWADERGWKRTRRDALLVFGGLIVLYFLYLWITLPDVSDETNFIPVQSSVIVDRNGVELYRLFSEEDRSIISKDDIPQSMKDAIVAIEDQRFYDRGCLDMRAIARVFLRFGQAGGASTLTRQLARNALNLQHENIINRKLKELILGCSLEHEYSKEDLLALYLNWIPFGQNAYGVEQAAQEYFGIGARDLTLAQSAVLAALPQRPSYFSPYGKHVRTELTDTGLLRHSSGQLKDLSDLRDDDFLIGLLGNTFGSGADALYVGGRTDQVLSNMEDLGMIKEEDHAAAIEELRTMEFVASRESIRAPHFVLWVKKQLETMLADGAEEGFLAQGGLTIRTTLDWKLQQIAETTINAKKDDIARLYGAHNIALVAADPHTKEILAYVGNVDYAEGEHDGKVDMALVPRQPGSSFKPFVYAAAFEEGYSPATILYDVPIKIGEDEPQNFDNSFRGLMNMRSALGASRNTTAAQTYFLAGEEDGVLDLVTRIGAPMPEETLRAQQEKDPDYSYGWPLALGAAELPLLEMVTGYSTFADAGNFKPLVSIAEIKDRRGSLIPMEHANDEPVEVMDPRIAYQITSVLSDPGVRPGEYWQSVLSVPGYQAAAKTGTSNRACPPEERKDGTCRIKPNNLLTLGYTPNLVVGVWVGNADATAMSEKAESLVTAAPIWKEFMTKAHKELEATTTSFTIPPRLVQPQVSLLSGELPTECTPIDKRRSDVFLQENSPNKQDPACVTAEIDRVTGLLASDSCPEDARQTQSFFVPYSPIPDTFPQWKQAMIAWSQRAGTGALPLPLLPTEECDISKTPGRLVRPTVNIDHPDDGRSATYPSFTPDFSSTGSPPREVLYEIDGKVVARVEEAPFTRPLRMPKSVAKSGTHTLKITYTDIYYNIATDSVSFTFEDDNDGPSVRFITPDDGDTVSSGSGIVISAEADDDGGIKYVQFFLDDQLLTTKPREPYEFTYTLPAPGTYRLRVEATDEAGNTADDEVEVTAE